MTTADSTTMRMADGEYDTTASPTPINFMNSSAQWQAINNSLEPDTASGYGAENTANSYQVEFPSTLGSAPVKLSVGSAWLGLTLDGASAPLSTSGSTASYPDALPNVNVSYQAEGDGSQEFLSLQNTSAPTSYSYAVTASNGISLSSTAADGLAIDSGGNQIGTIDAPTVQDAAGVTGTATMTVTTTATGWTVTVGIDPGWLDTSTRAFPVIIDPDVTLTASNICTINNEAVSAPQGCGGAIVQQVNNAGVVGVQKGLVQFALSSIPFDSQVTEATLTLGGTDYNTGTLQVQSLGQSWTPSQVTWDNASTSTAWTTAGGTVASTPASAVYNTTDNGDDATSWTYYPTQLVQDWVSGQATNSSGVAPTGAPNDGLLLSESTAPGYGSGISFDISSASLRISYFPQVGLSNSLKYNSYRLNDRSSLDVQVANQNGLVDAQDLNIRGAGLALNVDRVYNTLTQAWTFSIGQDVAIQTSTSPFNPVEQTPTGGIQTFTTGNSLNCTFQYDGSAQSWALSYTAAAGGDEDLCVNSSHNAYAVENHATGEVLLFGEGSYAVTSTGTLTGFTTRYLLSDDIDQNGDTISYTYASNNTLSGITDTQDRTFTVTASRGGHIASISGPTGSPQTRTWTYDWDPTTGLLDSYIDAADGTYQYTYNSNSVLDEVQTPGVNISGAVVPSETDIGLSGNAVTTITQKDASCTAVGLSTIGSCVTGYSQVRPASTSCTSHGTNASQQVGCATVEDANGNKTSYGFTTTDQVLKAVDALNNVTSVSYNADSQVATANDAAGSPATNFAYNHGPSGTADQVASATSPSAAESSFNYTTTNPYQPAGANDTQGNCTSLTYSPTSYGHVTSVGAGMTPVTGGTSTGCTGSATATSSATYQVSGATSGTSACGAPNYPGLTCTQTAPATQTLPGGPAGAVTSYTYNSLGEPTGTTPQGSSNTGTAATAGSTLQASSQTFDGLSRVATTTDANSNVTAYWYDNNDRLIQVVYGFTGTYNATAPPTCSNYNSCNVYTYDPDGNLLSRSTSPGTTTYTYDHFDRLSTEILPSTQKPGCASTTNDSLQYSYDNVGNIATECSSARTTSYTYDADNDLLSAGDTTSGTPTCPLYGAGTPINCVIYSYDTDRRMNYLEVPGGVTEAFTYQSNSAIHTVVVTGITSEATGVTPLNPANYGYDYETTGHLNTDLVQDFDGEYLTYDTLNRVISATIQGNTWHYTYDAFGNRLTSQENSGNTTWYSYNQANQLAWAYTGTTAPSSLAYNSPPSGDTDVYAYDPAGNQLTGLAAGTATTITYNQRNFTSKTVGASTYNYTYLDLDQSQRLSGGGSAYTNSPQGITRAQNNDFIRDPNGTLAWMYTPGTSASCYYLYDGASNVVGLVNTTDQLVDSYTYDPYGTTTATETVTQPFRYQSGYQDATGLYHFGARYYDPTTGRFTQLDPSGQSAGYLYAGDDPINNTDPTGQDIGLAGDLIVAGAGIAFGGGIGLAGAGAIAGLLGIGGEVSLFGVSVGVVDFASISTIATGVVTSVAGTIASFF